MKGYSKLLKTIKEVKQENNLSDVEIAEKIDNIANYYKRMGDKHFKENIALKAEKEG